MKKNPFDLIKEPSPRIGDRPHKIMKLQKFRTDDWEGWYLDGNLIAQGHSVETEEILKKIGINCESVYFDDENHLDEFGNSMPETAGDIELYIRNLKQ